jgi:hypothetical protein
MPEKFVDISHIALLELFETFTEQISPGMLNGTLIRTSIAAGEKFEVVDYGTLEEFVKASDEGETPLSMIEGRAIHYGNGLFGLPTCPFGRSISNYTQLNKEGLPKVFDEVTQRYNADRSISKEMHIGMGSGVSPFCAVHQPMRSTVARRVRVDGKPLLVFQLGCKSGDGVKALAPVEWMQELGFSEDEVNKILDENYCCYAVTIAY